MKIASHVHVFILKKKKLKNLTFKYFKFIKIIKKKVLNIVCK